MRLISDAPVKDSIVLGRYLDAIDAARRRVWIANAYFFPPPVLLDALTNARRRGADVKILVPGISDVAIVQSAAQAHYRRWMEAGLELWEYQGVVMHSKYALVDDEWCLVGTFNANVASVLFAIEVALVSRNRQHASAVESQMLQDFARSVLVDERRVRAVGFLRGIMDRLASTLMTLANRLIPRRPAALPPPQPERHLLPAPGAD
jgi:cardiolipin synthase